MTASGRYAVFGNPIEHSLSPLIHGEFARRTGRHIDYGRQLVEPGQFEAAARAFFAEGGHGLNVTVPFKQDAFRFATDLSSRARRAGAVNTLALQKNGVVLGDNTDGTGMVRDITVNLGWPVAGQKVLLLGAGGAVRGVLEPLLAERPAAITIANRTVARAQALAAAFADLATVVPCGFDALAGGRFDLVINGTSASLAGELPPLPEKVVSANGFCYDMMYGAVPTVFLRWAVERGVEQRADGLGMLVEQAAEAFCLWQGVRPETWPVMQWLRREVL